MVGNDEQAAYQAIEKRRPNQWLTQNTVWSGDLVIEHHHHLRQGAAADAVDLHGVCAKSILYWLNRVRKDGWPHTAPLVGVWVDRSFVFCTGPTEQRPATSSTTRRSPSSPARTPGRRGSTRSSTPRA
jgi:hypothetical protein